MVVPLIPMAAMAALKFAQSAGGQKLIKSGLGALSNLIGGKPNLEAAAVKRVARVRAQARAPRRRRRPVYYDEE